jgi:hypothetical protein
MTFTYSDPSDSDLEAVRFRIADTDSDRPLLTDEEIEYELAEAGDDVLLASLGCAEALIAKGSHKVTKKIGQMSINYSDLVGQYTALAASLQSKIGREDMTFSVPEAGKVADALNYPDALDTSVTEDLDWKDD